MNELDQTVVTAITHGHFDTLLKHGFKPEYIEDSDARAIYFAAAEMVHRTPAIKPNRLNLLSATTGELANYDEVKTILSMNGTGESAPETVVSKSYDRHLQKNARQVWERFQYLSNTKMGEIKQWLPSLAQELEIVATSGYAYNPNPEAHTGSIVAPIMFQSFLSVFNDMFAGEAGDGGGYRQGWWVVWMGHTGGGKCLAKGTPVLMFDGTTRAVETILPGEFVMGPDSNPRKVLGTTRGNEEMYQVTPVKGEPYTVNESHILSPKTSGPAATGKHGEVVNISVRDYLGKGRSIRNGVEFSAQRVPLDPYFLGIWLGDGTNASAHVTTMEPEVLECLHNVANSFGLHIRNAGETGKATTWAITGGVSGNNGNPLMTVMRELGVIENKHVPQIYKSNNRSTRLQVLAGLIDSDGYCSQGSHYDWISKYEVLADDICFLARSLGFAAYKKACKKSCPTTDGKIFTGDYWRVSICGDVDEIPCRVPRRKANPRQQIKDVLVTGITVKPVGVGEYYGFELDGDGLFLLGDFTVTHNTSIAYTQAVDAIRHGKKQVFVSKENQSQIRARILLGLTGLTRTEVETGVAEEQEAVRGADGSYYEIAGLGAFYKQEVRQQILEEWTNEIQANQKLRLYDWSFAKSAHIKSIVATEDPDILTVDYIDQNDVPGNNDKIGGLGKISSEMEKIAHNSGKHINGFFQIAADERKKYEKSDFHDIVGPFGSSMVTHPADQVFQTKKWKEPYTQHIRRTKCRAGGLNKNWVANFDRSRWIFQDKEQLERYNRIPE